MHLGCGSCWNITRYGVVVFWFLTSHLNPRITTCVSGDCRERGPWLGAHVCSFWSDYASVGPAVSGPTYKGGLQIPLLTVSMAYFPFCRCLGAQGPSGASSWGLKEVYLRSLLDPSST